MMDLSCYDEFIVDYNNPHLTLEDVRRKHGLNCRRLAEIKEIAVSNGDISPVRHMNRTDAKFYTETSNGFVVKKQFGNDCLLVGRFEEESTAQLVVNKCKEVNWNVNQISDFIDEHKIQPKNYTYYNDSYIVQKVINGKNTVFCKVDNETTAQKVVKELRKCNWDKTKTKQIIEMVS